MAISNNLTVEATVTVIFAKANDDTTSLTKTIEVGGAWTAGPMDYQQASATFRYVVREVSLSKPQAVRLSAPFEGVRGVTPLLRIDISANGNSATDVSLRPRLAS